MVTAGTILQEEFRAGYARYLSMGEEAMQGFRSHQQELKRQQQQFGDLMITAHPDGLCRIPKTSERAISLDQLQCIVTHAETRLLVKCEKWAVSRLGEGEWWKRKDYMLEDPKEITLYDLADYVIRPATKSFNCSLVEIMADKPQPPDYFVSQ